MPWLSSVAITKSAGVPRTSSYWPVASSCQSTSAMYLKPTSRLLTTCAPNCRPMRVISQVVTSVVMTIGDGGSDPDAGQLAQLEVRQQARRSRCR